MLDRWAAGGPVASLPVSRSLLASRERLSFEAPLPPAACCMAATPPISSAAISPRAPPAAAACSASAGRSPPLPAFPPDPAGPPSSGGWAAACAASSFRWRTTSSAPGCTSTSGRSAAVSGGRVVREAAVAAMMQMLSQIVVSTQHCQSRGAAAARALPSWLKQKPCTPPALPAVLPPTLPRHPRSRPPRHLPPGAGTDKAALLAAAGSVFHHVAVYVKEAGGKVGLLWAFLVSVVWGCWRGGGGSVWGDVQLGACGARPLRTRAGPRCARERGWACGGMTAVRLLLTSNALAHTRPAHPTAAADGAGVLPRQWDGHYR